MSDPNLFNVGELVVYPDTSPAEVIETAQVLAEDPTGDLLGFTADAAASGPDPEAA